MHRLASTESYKQKWSVAQVQQGQVATKTVEICLATGVYGSSTSVISIQTREIGKNRERIAQSITRKTDKPPATMLINIKCGYRMPVETALVYRRSESICYYIRSYQPIC